MKKHVPVNIQYLLHIKIAILSCCLLAFAMSAAWSQTINTHPSDASACNGGNTSFTVAASGAASYQWQVSTDTAQSWQNLADGGIYNGTNTPVLGMTGVLPLMNSYQYRCIVTGGGAVTSNPAVLTVNPPVSTIDQTLINCPTTGSNITASLVAGTSYSWQLSTDNGANWNNLSNGTDGFGVSYSGTATNSLFISNLSPSIDGYAFRYIASDGNGCVATSAKYIQKVPALASIATLKNDTVVAAGNGAHLAAVVTAGTGPFTYQWQLSNNGGVTYSNLANNATYTGVATNNLIISGVSTAMATSTTRYRVLVRNAGACASVSTTNARLIIDPTFIVLPVKLLSFTAQKISPASVQLWWSADAQYPARSFVVQKSTGSLFTDIGEVHTAANKTAYTFTDNTLQNGTTQYRLKMTGNDGVITYSFVINIASNDITNTVVLKPSVTGKGSVSVYTVLSQPATIHFTITTPAGQLLYMKSAATPKGGYTTLLDIGMLSKGIYYVQVSGNNGMTKTLPLIKL